MRAAGSIGKILSGLKGHLAAPETGAVLDISQFVFDIVLWSEMFATLMSHGSFYQLEGAGGDVL